MKAYTVKGELGTWVIIGCHHRTLVVRNIATNARTLVFRHQLKQA
jgi:hypothetical protein